jgi:hypothetical protein
MARNHDGSAPGVHSSVLTHICLTSKLSNESSAISNGHKTRGLLCTLIRVVASSAMLILTLLAAGASSTQMPPLSICYTPELVISSGMLAVFLFGPQECKPWLHYLQLKLNTYLWVLPYLTVTFVMQLLTELVSLGIQLATIILPKIKCKVFEDNISTIELAKTPWNVFPDKIHWHTIPSLSWSGTTKEDQNLSHLSTHEQVANIATKPPL